jgi:hypothetical protein
VFQDATLTGQRDAALAIAREAVRRDGLLVTYCDVLVASQRDVGRRWQRNRITVADEHRATAITQYVLAALYPEVAARAPWRGTGLVTGVAGESANVPAVIDLVDRIRHSRACSVTILAGGSALTAAPELCHELDIGPPVADVQDAVDTARSLT